MEDCIFCKISRHEIPADIIHETDEVLAFLDIRPVNKGHALIIPKKHSVDVLETDDQTLTAMMAELKKVAAGIMEAMGATGFNLHINTKPAAGQVVFHVHFHIIPRFAGDGLKLWPHSEMEPKTRAEIAAEIKRHIR